jgi:histone deacetylase 8
MGLMSPEFSSIKRIQVINPGRAEFKDLSVYHSRDYLDFVLEPKNSNSVSVVEAEVTAEFGLEDVRSQLFLEYVASSCSST